MSDGSRTRPLRRALVFAAVLFAVHAGGSRALDALGIADRLLASGGSAPGLAVVVAGLLIVRLLLYFVAPGVVVAAAIHALASRRA